MFEKLILNADSDPDQADNLASSIRIRTMPNLPTTFHENWSRTSWVILLTGRQTGKQTKKSENITSSFGWGNKGFGCVVSLS